MNPLLGKYRGIVVDCDDPMRAGRLRVSVPAVDPDASCWASPCVPYLGPDPASYPVPPAGTAVWVEFEQGDTSLPIWTGAFWPPSDD